MTGQTTRKKSAAHPEERRAFARFEVPGASLAYRAGSFLRRKTAEEFCPVQNLSRGGLKILCRLALRNGQKIRFSLSFQEDDLSLAWSGCVVWIYPVRDADFAFSAGIQFDPLDAGRSPGAAAFLLEFAALEKRYSPRRR